MPLPLGTCSKCRNEITDWRDLTQLPSHNPIISSFCHPHQAKSLGDWMVITQYLCSSFISTVQGFLPVSPPSSSLRVLESRAGGFQIPRPLQQARLCPSQRAFVLASCLGKGFRVLRKPEPHKGASFLRLLTTHLWMNMVVLNEYALCGFYWMSSSSLCKLFIAVLFRSESSRMVAPFDIVGSSEGS